MTSRSEWFTLVDESNTVVGVVAHEVALLLISGGVANPPLDGGRTLRLLSKAHEHTGITATVPSARLVSAPSPVSAPTSAPSLATVIQKKFTGESADEEIEYLNSDDKVRLDRALVGADKPPAPQGDTDKAFTSLDEWLMAVHEVKQAGHSLACFTAPKERVAVVLDYSTDKSYSLPFRYLYATSHGVQPATVKAWGFEKEPLELLRQVRDHNLRECLVAGKADPLTKEGVLDAQPDAELEALFMGDAVEVLAAFHDHTESMKNQPGFSRSPDAP
jgi:hypothetical protein